MELRAKKVLQGTAFSWLTQLGGPGQGDAQPAQSCPHHPHPNGVTGRFAESAGCRVLPCCPLVVLENVRSSQFPLLSGAESEERDFLSV